MLKVSVCFWMLYLTTSFTNGINLISPQMTDSISSFEKNMKSEMDNFQTKWKLCNALFKEKRHRIAGAKIFSSNDIGHNPSTSTFRIAHQNVYLWPSLTDHEKSVIRDAFYQISRRTCLKFNELDYKPWYHSDRWMEEKPYVVIRKSKTFTGYSDNTIEGINRRSLLYLTENALNHKSVNQSRGIAIAQILRFMGYREENLRPDASSYIQPKNKHTKQSQTPHFSNEQLQWPFDPESVTIGGNLRNTHELTIYCQARKNENIGAGQRAGLLTRWDAVKLNSMYCPKRVGYADPRLGPCVLPRKRKN